MTPIEKMIDEACHKGEKEAWQILLELADAAATWRADRTADNEVALLQAIEAWEAIQ